MELSAIQKALRHANIDGWLFYDFHNRDAIAARVLKMDTKRFASRRWYYYIPTHGDPIKLVHQIEPWRCDHLPGSKLIYLSWQDQQKKLQNLLKNASTIAMQYSPNNAIPYVSIVDAGTIELIRGFDINIVSSADLVGQFEAHLSDENLSSHKQAAKIMQMVKDKTFKEIGRQIEAGENPTEYAIQSFMHELMQENDMFWEDGPVVAINEHAADPHFEPTRENSFSMKKGDLVLLDLWAKKNSPGSIYYDITWMGYIGENVPEKLEMIFQIVVNARNRALDLVKDRFSKNTPVYGWEVDDACRKVIIEAQYGKYFTHRTGHNIGEQVHGNGVNIDNLETKDERKILPGTCFSIEPGIYLPHQKMGFRTEIDVFIADNKSVIVYGDQQKKIIPILTLV